MTENKTDQNMVKCGVCHTIIIASPTDINLSCDHHFHRKCLKEVKNKKICCPVCISPKEFTVMAINPNIIRISDGLVGSCYYDPTSGYYIYPPNIVMGRNNAT